MKSRRERKNVLSEQKLSSGLRWPRVAVSDRWLASRDERLNQAPPATSQTPPQEKCRESELLWMRDTSGWYLPCAPSDWPDDKYYDPRELYNLEGRNNDRKFLPHVALREANTL